MAGQSKPETEAAVSEREAAENEIFRLQQKADTYLQVGDVEGFTRLRILISHLQEITGAVKGVEGKKGNDRAA